MTPTAIAEPKTSTVFMSRSPNQVLVRRQLRVVSDGFGGQRTLSYSDWLVEEEELNRRRTLNGEDPLPIDDTPWRAEFANSEYSIPDAIDGHVLSEEGKERFLEWLRQHPLNGTPHGFWELGNAPDEPKPSTMEQMVAIAEASAGADLDRLEAVVRLEVETHNRRDVLMAAEAGLARLRALEPEIGSEDDVSDEDADEPRARHD